MPADFIHRHRNVERTPGDRTFLATFAATFVLLAGALAGTVWLTDPLAKFGTGFLPPVVSADRDYKAALYRASSARPGVVVLGSSRVKTLRPACIASLADAPAFNFGVNAGVAEDYLAIFRFLRAEPGFAVREILLGADPEAFAGEAGAGRALRASRILGAYAPVPADRGSSRVGGAADLLALESVAASLRSVRRQLLPGGELPQEAIASDGWQTHPRWDAEIARGEFHQPVKVGESVIAVSRRYRVALHLSPGRLRLLEQLLQEAATSGVKVTAFIPPVHPDLARSSASNALSALTSQMEAVLQDAERRGLLRFVPTAESAGYPNDAGLYYDAVHMMAPNGDRLLSWVYQGDAGAACAV